MIADNFAVDPIDWTNPHDRDACRAVREEVFVIEQKVPIEDEWDDLDAVSQHVLARDLAGNPIGTGRLVPPQGDGPPRIGRMAVLKAWRGKHVGEALLHRLTDRARELGYRTLEMHAQSHAVPFYARFGFAAYGAEFFECDIAHVHMRRELDALAPPKRPDPNPASLPQPIDSREQAIAATIAVIGAARRELCVYTRNLDPALLDIEPALEAIKTLAISGRGVRIRILVQEPQPAAQDGHRLIALAQRLSSAIEFRTPGEEDRQYASAFLINDDYGYYFRALGARYEGETASHALGRVSLLQEYFDAVWERAVPCEELRQLSL